MRSADALRGGDGCPAPWGGEGAEVCEDNSTFQMVVLSKMHWKQPKRAGFFSHKSRMVWNLVVALSAFRQ